MAKTVKDIFDAAESGSLSWEQFQEAAKDCKFVDINSGEYVSKRKFDDTIASKDSVIEGLNSTISSRTKDMEALKNQLSEAGADSEKLASLTNEITELQGRYDNEVKGYKAQLKKQAYEFAVKDFANSKKFSSAAARRDFIQSMIAKELKMEGDTILGADDFVTAYSADNADAFLTEPEPQPEPEPPVIDNKPQFVAQTPGGEPKTEDAASEFTKAFHFTNFVRPPEQ